MDRQSPVQAFGAPPAGIGCACTSIHGIGLDCDWGALVGAGGDDSFVRRLEVVGVVGDRELAVVAVAEGLRVVTIETCVGELVGGR